MKPKGSRRSARSSKDPPARAAPAPRVCDSVLEAIGGTPLVRVRKFITGPNAPRCYFKLEATNPGGSSKDRSALEMVRAAEREGIKPGTTFIVSTSGNMGIGLALVCAHKGYPLICLVDPKISPVNERILQIYGAKVIKVFKRDGHGGYHLTRLAKVKELRRRYPKAVYIDQYDNRWNAYAHYRGTAPEILRALRGRVRAVVVAAGTGGTIMGVSRYFKEHSPKTHVWAVDEHGSVALPSNSVPQMRFLNGMGTGIRPGNYDYANLHKLIDKQHYVNASQAIQAALDLARSEGILAGGSGGAVAHVMRNVMSLAYGKGENIVGILPDHGSRYTHNLFDDQWLAVRELDVLGLSEPAVPAEVAAGNGHGTRRRRGP